MKKPAFRKFLIAVALLIPVVAVADGRFTIYEFKLKGRVNSVINDDLDADGKIDVVALQTERSGDVRTRWLSILLQNKTGGFAQARRFDWKIPAEVGAVDVGDVDPDPGRELVFITEKGVSYSLITGNGVGPMKHLEDYQSVMAIASDRMAPYYNFVWDYTGDGKDDVMVIGFYEAMFLKQGPNYTFIRERLEIRPDIDVFAFDIDALMSSPEHPTFRVAYNTPQIYAEDYNADKLPDIISASQREILIFLHGPDGFAEKPTKRYRIKLFDEKEGASGGAGRRGGGPPPSYDFQDIDGDGRVDIVVIQMRGNIGAMKSKAVLFWGKSNNIEQGKPDIEFKTENPVMGKIIIWDVNRDKLPDLIMPTYEISAWNLGKILFTGDISVEWLYYLQRKDHTFPTVPDRTITTDMKINLGKFRLESGIPNVIADFNGDGYPDQAMGESENTLDITLRDQNGQPMDTVEKVNVPVATFFRAVDLDNDNRSDLIMYYIDQAERGNELRILMNVGPWQ